MKNIKKLLGLLTIALMVFSCTDDYSEAIEVSGNAGFLVDVSTQSSGALLGSPETGTPIADAPVTVSEAALDLNVLLVAGDLSTVSEVKITKQINNGTISVVAQSTTLPLNVSISSIAEFLQGSGLTESDLRIGDVVKFVVQVVKTDGQVYQFDNQGRFNLTLNCSSDLTGTYVMTNTVCASSEMVTISQNSDGTWALSQADGGLLQFCSSNTTFVNPGTIEVGCGGIVTSTEGAQYCGSNGIGCITGGSWDQNSGVLTLDNTNTFFTWAASSYTSTYVRI
ncbi:hypothetical protein [Lacinutrix sp. Bg11-31]|uniref:hypothetical protein n=1 Tax=Lacinutrix sp. Bg11-31 TaxID=2057808 RepID=UPI000C30F505|nr:hypothetical protein [Lacinutrix sp. Bg11-31]AUC82345.1 hypothetical protein CW733_09450 [Lacinutrix sp. Bg11-31]